MEVYLIRHTCPAVDKGICYGQTDLGLAASFEAEKEAVLEQLPDDLDLVYTSPLKRCMQLAQAIAEMVPSEEGDSKGSPIPDERLKELHFGTWEMQKWNEIPRDELDPWGNNYLKVTVPGGESFQDLVNRLAAFWEELKAQHQGKKIAVVTHHGIIQALMLLENMIEEKELFSRQVPYGGVVKIERV
jgi:alpha-ribazole phosphatase